MGKCGYDAECEELKFSFVARWAKCTILYSVVVRTPVDATDARRAESAPLGYVCKSFDGAVESTILGNSENASATLKVNPGSLHAKVGNEMEFLMLLARRLRIVFWNPFLSPAEIVRERRIHLPLRVEAQQPG